MIPRSGRLLVRLVCAASLALRAEPWPQFRGLRGDGTSIEQLSDQWRQLWKTRVPGTGHSSPSIWGTRLFLTSFEPETHAWRQLAGYRGRLFVLALDTRTGREVWRREVPAGVIEKNTSINSPATPTPATDGERVYSYFGSFGLVALTVAGKDAWTHRIGPHPHHMGAGSSPVLAGGVLYLNAETDGPSSLLALDARTGKVRWQTPRRTRQAGYASAAVWGELVVVAGHERVTAYGRQDGRERWSVTGLSQYVVPTAVPAGDLAFATSSGPGGNALLALRRDGSVQWQGARGAAYVASPVVAAAGRRLVTLNSNCVATAIEAATGRLIQQSRLTGLGECYASPVATPGRIHVAGMSGELQSIDDTTFDQMQRIETGERIIASPAISGGLVYIRTANSVIAYSASPALQ